MANRLKPNGGEEQGAAIPQHNSKVRKDIINEVCASLHSLESERASLNESIAELKNKRIKGDLGMKIGDFNLAYRLYKLEGADRNLALDTLRETFEALGIGEQLDWLSAAKPAASDVTGAPV